MFWSTSINAYYERGRRPGELLCCCNTVGSCIERPNQPDSSEATDSNRIFRFSKSYHSTKRQMIFEISYSNIITFRDSSYCNINITIYHLSFNHGDEKGATVNATFSQWKCIHVLSSQWRAREIIDAFATTYFNLSKLLKIVTSRHTSRSEFSAPTSVRYCRTRVAVVDWAVSTGSDGSCR